MEPLPRTVADLLAKGFTAVHVFPLLGEPGYGFAFSGENVVAFYRTPPAIAAAFSEDWGEQDVRAYMARRKPSRPRTLVRNICDGYPQRDLKKLKLKITTGLRLPAAFRPLVGLAREVSLLAHNLREPPPTAQAPAPDASELFLAAPWRPAPQALRASGAGYP